MVDFYAEWCGPHREFIPLVQELAEQLAGRARFVDVNIDEAATVTRSYGIHTLPTFLFVESGRERARAVGAIDAKAFRAMVARHVGPADRVVGSGPTAPPPSRLRSARSTGAPRGARRAGRRN